MPAAARRGYGLPGLRERVAMLRGEFEARPDDRGGFVVSAMLPAPVPARASAAADTARDPA